MCGIAGFVGKGNLSILKKMTDSIRYRGPDADGHWVDTENSVYLGHRRLSILDIAGGIQPMFSSDKSLCIIFNGEIYNFKEIRDELIKLGYKFKTDHSDTEVILYAYKEWGASCVQKFNGMWAFSIYDRIKKKLFCSRDRFGKKPFFYSKQNGSFVFGSELHLFKIHPSVNCSLSKKSLQKYFGYGYIPAPNTLYENIFKLPGGHNLEYDLNRGEIKISKYWDYVLEPFDRIPEHPEEEWGEEIRRLLDQAVQRRLVSDVPLGIFLSGGIDSSAVTAFASRHVPKGKLKTFSIGFTEKSFDESYYANLVSKKFDTEHYSDILSMEKAVSILPEIIGKLDEPMGDSSILPTYLLSRFTRQQVTVALGGDAGDELFAGYDPFKALNPARIYSKFIPGKIHSAIQYLFAKLPVSHRNMSLDFKIKRTLRGLNYSPKLWTPVWMATLAPSELEELFNEKIDPEDLYSEAIIAWESCKQEDLTDRVTQFYIKLYMQDDILVKVDRASMMNSLEVRAPFLDIDFVDFARKIPAAYRYRDGETKYILKKALESILPYEILYRSKKGFGVPIGKWIIDKSLSFTDSNSEYMNNAFFRKKLENHQNLRSDERAFLWNWWVLNRFL